MPDPQPAAGSQAGPDDGKLVGKYRVVRRLASGGMGEVFLARVEGPAGFEKTLVLKRVLRRLQGEPRFIEMFLNEARIAAQLSHPNVVHIYELVELEGSYVIAMEYVEGLSLRALLTAAKARMISLSPALACHLCAQALHGLHYAHLLRDERGRVRGVVHRDVSPENILLGYNGSVKVADFGLARAAEAAVDLKPLGKVSYMAPEQRLGGLIDARADLYAMGVVLSEALTGQPLDGLSEVPRLPEPMLDAVVRRALSANPDGRYLSAGEMAEALEAFARTSSEANTTRLGDLVRLAAVKLGPGEDTPGALTQLTVPAYLHGAQSSAPDAKSEDVVALTTPPPPPPTPPKPTRYEKQPRMTAELDITPLPPKQPKLKWAVPAGLVAGGLLALAVWLASGSRSASTTDAGVLVATRPNAGTPNAGTPNAGTPNAGTPNAGTPNAGTQSAGTQNSGTPNAGTQSAGTQSAGTQNAGTQNAGTQNSGTQNAGSQNSGTQNSGTQNSATQNSGTQNAGTQNSATQNSATQNSATQRPVKKPLPTSPEPRLGLVQVRVHPWAEVFLGSRFLGTTPFPAVELPAGRLTLTIKNSELNVTRNIVVQVRPGEETSVFENLMK